MSNSNRRHFLRLITTWGLASTSVLAGKKLLRSGRCDEPEGETRKEGLPITKTSRALGSDVSLTAWHPDQDTAAAAVDAAFDELRLVDRLMSLYQPQSQLSRLNREQVLEDPHPYMLEVLRQAKAMSRRSSGAFDVTVQPLWRLYADAQRDGGLPSADLVERARKCVDWRRVDCSPKRICLHESGMSVTLNGIGQGFAADRVAAALYTRGVRSALINTGEVRALGEKPRTGAWNVGIQHPRHDDAYISIAGLAGRSLATSGDYATTFSDDYRHHHLFDPHSGHSPDQLSSVSVVATTATQADALSTAVFVLGPDRGLNLIRSYPGADALLVKKDGTVLVTDTFPSVRA